MSEVGSGAYQSGLDVALTLKGLTRAESLALVAGALDALPPLHPAREKPESLSLFRADPFESESGRSWRRYVVQVEDSSIGRATAMLAALLIHCETVASADEADR